VKISGGFPFISVVIVVKIFSNEQKISIYLIIAQPQIIHKNIHNLVSDFKNNLDFFDH